MDLGYTDTQAMLRDMLSRFLADTYGFEQRRRMLSRPEGRDPGIWRALATDLGLLSAPFPENVGGMGGGAVETMIVMEELGQVIAVEPWLQTVVIGGGALGLADTPLAAEMIAGIIAGDVQIAFAYAEGKARYDLQNVATTARGDGAGYLLDGHKAVVLAAPGATHLLVTARVGGSAGERAGVELFLIDAALPGISRRDYPTVDGCRASEIWFENVALSGDALLPGGISLIEQVADRAIAGLCAEATGVAAELLRQTVAYAGDRRQFGQPIGKFQVLQHRMADMMMEAEQIRSMALGVTLQLDLPAEQRMASASLAKAKVGRALRFVGQGAVQLHGGIGITDELAIGHYFKRATMIEGQFGSPDYHLNRYEALTLVPAA